MKTTVWATIIENVVNVARLQNQMTSDHHAREETKGQFCKRVVLANVPLSWFLGSDTHRRLPPGVAQLTKIIFCNHRRYRFIIFSNYPPSALSRQRDFYQSEKGALTEK